MPTTECPEYDHCKDRRVADAEHRGAVLARLESIDQNVKALWEEQKTNRSDFKKLYFHIGLISGGTSLIVSLVVSLLFKA